MTASISLKLWQQYQKTANPAPVLVTAARTLLHDLTNARVRLPDELRAALKTDTPEFEKREDAYAAVKLYDESGGVWIYEFMATVAIETIIHDGFTVSRMGDLSDALEFRQERIHLLIDKALANVFGCSFDTRALEQAQQMIILAVVATFIFSDRQLHVRELEHLKQLMMKFGMEVFELTDLSQYQDITASAMIKQLPESLHLPAVVHALRLVMADHAIRAAEVRAVQALIGELGISFNTLRQLVFALDIERGEFSPQLVS